MASSSASSVEAVAGPSAASKEAAVVSSTNDVSPGRHFQSFDDVKALLEELKTKFNHPLRVFNSQSVQDYNQRRLKAKIPLDPVDKKWLYTYYSVRCVHYGQPRKRSRGLRPNQRHFSMSCPVKIVISYDRAVSCLVLRECSLDHNHRIGSEIMKHYPSSRRLNAEDQGKVNELLQLKPNNKHLKEHLQLKYRKLTTLKDIQNMKANAKKLEMNGRNDQQVLLDTLEDALKHDLKAKVVNEENELAVVFYESGHMAELFVKFPEIPFIDGTYNVNNRGMPLYCFMVEDGFGYGRNVFYAATAQEDSQHM